MDVNSAERLAAVDDAIEHLKAARELVGSLVKAERHDKTRSEACSPGLSLVVFNQADLDIKTTLQSLGRYRMHVKLARLANIEP